MAIKSEAQRKRLQTLAQEGKLKPETLTAMEQDAEFQSMPQRAAWPRVKASQKVKTLRPIKSLGKVKR